VVNATIYLEGGGDSKDLHVRCREGFRKLLEQCGYSGRMPRLVACGGRGAAYDSFRTAHESRTANQFVAMLIDSEDPLADVEKVWDHLQSRDGWDRPGDANDEQVLLMTTCMETWIVCDRSALREHYGANLRESALPALVDLEKRLRHQIQDALFRATKDCSNAYQKGKRSFEVLAKLTPAMLESQLPSFARIRRILNVRCTTRRP
jgi:Domain of unknown function (DUF4276)